MRSSRLLSTLALLDQTGLKRLEAFLESPYFGAPERCLQLLRVLRPFAPGFEATELTKTFVFNQLHPEKPFNDQRLRDDLSLLYRSVKTFLSMEALQNFPGIEDWMLLRALQEHKAPHLFEVEERPISAAIAAREQPDEKAYYLAYRIADEKNQLFGTRQVREADDSLVAKVAALDTYYLYVRLRESCEILNRAAMLNTAQALIPAELPALAMRYDHVPQIRLYRMALAMLYRPSEIAPFETLRDALLAESGLLSRDEAAALFRFAHNHCIRRLNAGQLSAAASLLGLYRHQLKTGLLPLKDTLDHVDYRNIVMTAVRNQEYTWAKEFAETWRERVDPAFREVAYSYLAAAIHFETQHYREAIRLLQTVEPADVFYYLAARVLLIRVFYETGDYETMGYQMASFKTYLKRDKSLSEAQKKPRLGFLELATALMRTAEAGDSDRERRKQQLAAALTANPQTLQLAWLREKVETL